MLSIGDKYKIIQRLAAGTKQTQICREQGLANSVVSRIWVTRNEIQELYHRGLSENKRSRSSVAKGVDEALFNWIQSMVSLNEPFGKIECIQQANQFAEDLGLEWKCTQSWFTRFKARHNIVFQIKSRAPTVPSSNSNSFSFPPEEYEYEENDDDGEAESVEPHEFKFHNYLPLVGHTTENEREFEDPLSVESAASTNSPAPSTDLPNASQVMHWLKQIQGYVKAKVTDESEKAQGLKDITSLKSIINQPKITDFFKAQ